ncbi:siphovirus Gp157 family protein [Pararhizobium mangrovi]|uniref:Siphovirus Gp157 family protein n=1 Tax=Pararhizobium mangrovi TaxID=2590452 RepID=A0A506U4M9_9HYPH|nr:siphovirus Gp157 family protein [Pararhizobium mangrovi]TPW26847.1 hypothetical protein FJU11_13660 [Pararhizobium mangrovi]
MNAHMEAGYLKAEIDRLMDQYPELEDDETLRADMLDGETDLTRVMERLLDRRQSARGMNDAAKERAGAIMERSKRYGRQEEAFSALMLSIMERANLDKLTLPEATLSIRKPSVSVNVTAIDELPQGYFQTERKADKKAIGDALKRGDEIPGAELMMGKETLSVRVK